jgi:type II secretory ATPase GspE/PulE/Tfp pilus assembly ATPase PilB-like protein
MGVEPYQLVAGFRGAVAQRLVRRLCTRCCEETPTSEAERSFAAAIGHEAPPSLMHARGCHVCKATGFKGRVPIGEAYQATEDLLRAIGDRKSSLEVEQIARAMGFGTMAADGYTKVLGGLTTVEEVVAAIHG